MIGTSSLRRIAQLKRAYPNLVFKDIVSFLVTVPGILFICVNVDISIIILYAVIYWYNLAELCVK